MKHLCQVLVLGWLSLTGIALGDAFFELDGPSGFYGSPGVPPEAFEKLVQAQKASRAELKCVAFTPGGDWVVLAGRNAFWTSNVNLPAARKLAEMQKDPNADLKCVAFAPGGGWTILSGQNGSWTEGDIPEGAFRKIQQVGGKGGALRSIAFAPNGGWVLLFDKTGVASGDIPPDLTKVLKDARKRRLSVICVAFTTVGDWICLTDNGWWTSNLNMDASKFIDQNLKRGYVPKWVAILPEDTGQGPYWLETKKSQHVVATLTTDIAHPDAQVDEWLLYAPQVPNLPGQQHVRTTFVPGGDVIKEASPLQRPVIQTRITDGRKEVHAVLTIEATLMSRHLRLLGPGQPAPVVKDLSPEAFTNYTAPPPLAPDQPEFLNWMKTVGLLRKDGESDMDYAHRAFAYIKHHFTYQWPSAAPTVAGICRLGKSDCGGLSAVFMCLMRANGVPARLLGGRWAGSQQGDQTQTHVKSEFFARGVGWVPVDASGAVGDTAGSDFACFGHDGGDFIAMADAQDLSVDSIHPPGRKNIAVFQGIVAWWRGSGPDKNSRWVEMWTVQKK